MTVTRKTVSLPAALVKEIERLAHRERKSFSSAIADLVDEAVRHRKALPHLLKMMESDFRSGLPDLGTNSEAYLAHVYREFDD